METADAAPFSVGRGRGCFAERPGAGMSFHDRASQGLVATWRRRRLREGGMLLLVDTIQEEHESRESSIAAYCSWVGATWGTVPPEVQHSIFEHIRGFDHPEKSSTIHRLAAEAGFERGTDVNHHRWHRTWCFEK